MKFVTVGYIEWRKGQDILVDAIEKIGKENIDSCEFLLIGQNQSVLAKKLSERIKEMPWIRMTGTINRMEVHHILGETDVMICPSREDPMPTVCAEAMMHKVPCLVSDAVGTAEYIDDYENGLIFKNGDIEELKCKILWCINHQTALKEMGKAAHKIYEEIFSIEAFEKNLLEYVEEMIGKA